MVATTAPRGSRGGAGPGSISRFPRDLKRIAHHAAIGGDILLILDVLLVEPGIQLEQQDMRLRGVANPAMREDVHAQLVAFPMLLVDDCPVDLCDERLFATEGPSRRIQASAHVF